jgi:hypothetical protein
MGDPGYTAMGKASDTQFVDPTGNYAKQQANLQNLTAQSAYDQFIAQSGGLANMAQGATAPLTQSLNAIAAREAALGGEAALGAMPGAAQSGAGMAAYGQAYGDPFAKAQAAIQQQQLGLTGQLWNSAMNNDYSTYNNLMGQQTALAQGQGAMWSPTYEKNKGFWDYAAPVLGAAAGAATKTMMGG